MTTKAAVGAVLVARRTLCPSLLSQPLDTADKLSDPNDLVHIGNRSVSVATGRAEQRPVTGLCSFTRVPLSVEQLVGMPTCPHCDQIAELQAQASASWPST